MRQNGIKTRLEDELMQKIEKALVVHYSQMLGEQIKAGLKKKKESEVKVDKQ